MAKDNRFRCLCSSSLEPFWVDALLLGPIAQVDCVGNASQVMLVHQNPSVSLQTMRKGTRVACRLLVAYLGASEDPCCCYQG